MSAEGFWAIVEIMGRTQHAGFVTEVVQFGVTFACVSIPQEDGSFEEKLCAGQAIFRISKCTEDQARAAAAAMRPRPYTALYPQLTGPADDQGEPEDVEPLPSEGLDY